MKTQHPQLNFLKKYGILGFNNCIYTIMAIFFALILCRFKLTTH